VFLTLIWSKNDRLANRKLVHCHHNLNHLTPLHDLFDGLDQTLTFADGL